MDVGDFAGAAVAPTGVRVCMLVREDGKKAWAEWRT